MEHSVQNEYILQHVYKSLSHDIQMPAFHTSALDGPAYFNPQNIDDIVETELNRYKEICLRKEQQYVEQMLLQNPIVIERRINNNQHQIASSDEEVDVVTVNSPVKQCNYAILQQRAEACRRSRYNNKIKKAKSKYRHKFITQKLQKSTQIFDRIQDLIGQAENYLLTHGLTRDRLQHLRQSYGMDDANL